ncbi:MAG: TonB-dependent receptor [Pseudomonadota bacterium]
MKTFRHGAFASLTPMLLASTALAQAAGEGLPFDLGTLVISADNRVETPVSESTRSVTVVTAEEIDRQSAVTTTIGDVLANTTPGFSQSNQALSDFGQTLRGRTFLVLIDGVPQSTPLRDGRRSLNSIDSSAVEQIEVVRGGNAVFGFGASGGTVNIVTKRPEDGESRSYVEAGFGISTTETDDSESFSFSFGTTGREGNVDYLFDVSGSNLGANFDADGLRIPSDTLGAQGGTSETESYSILAKIGLNFDDDRQRLQFSALKYQIEADPEFGGISFAGDPANDIRTPAVLGNANPVNPGTDNFNFNIEYTHEDIMGSRLSAQIYYTDLEITYGKFPGFPQTQILSEKLGARVTVNTPIEGFLGTSGANVTWGLDVLQDETQQLATDADQFFPGGVQPDPILDQTARALFAQLELPLSDRFNVSTGLRHEWIDIDVSDFIFVDASVPSFTPTSGGSLSFSETLFNVTASYDVTDKVQIYGGYSEGFTVADIGRSLTDATFATLTDVESEAQRTENYEVGARFSGPTWDGSLVAFVSESDNGTTFLPGTITILKQPERIWGVEATANFDVIDTVRIGGTLTIQNGEVDTNDDGVFDEDLPTTRIPPTKLTAYVDFQPTDWWAARIQATYSGTQSNNSSAFGGGVEIDDYIIVDAYSAFEVGPGTLNIGIENLFNEDYTPVLNQAYNSSFAYARGPGRTLSASYRVAF